MTTINHTALGLNWHVSMSRLSLKYLEFAETLARKVSAFLVKLLFLKYLVITECSIDVEMGCISKYKLHLCANFAKRYRCMLLYMNLVMKLVPGIRDYWTPVSPHPPLLPFLFPCINKHHLQHCISLHGKHAGVSILLGDCKMY